MMVKATQRTPKARDISQERNATRLIDVPLDKLDPAPFNARGDAAAGVDELVPSVRDLGLLQPMLCRPKADGRYELVAGERRFHAAKAAGLATAPAVVRELSDAEALVAGLAENLARRNLNPIERARGLDRLVAPIDAGGAGLTTKATAKLFGRSSEWCSNHVRLLRLPEAWQARLAAGDVTERMARSLVPFVDQPDVLAAVERDREQNPWAYRTSADFERSVKRVAAGEISAPAATSQAIKPPRAAPAAIHRAAPRPERDDRLDAAQAAERDSDQAFIAVRDRADVDAAIAGDHAVEAIIDYLGQLVELEQIEEVETAIVKRRAELMKLSRNKNA